MCGTRRHVNVAIRGRAPLRNEDLPAHLVLVTDVILPLLDGSRQANHRQQTHRRWSALALQAFNPQALSNCLWALTGLRHHPGERCLRTCAARMHVTLHEYTCQVRI